MGNFLPSLTRASGTLEAGYLSRRAPRHSYADPIAWHLENVGRGQSSPSLNFGKPKLGSSYKHIQATDLKRKPPTLKWAVDIWSVSQWTKNMENGLYFLCLTTMRRRTPISRISSGRSPHRSCSLRLCAWRKSRRTGRLVRAEARPRRWLRLSGRTSGLCLRPR